MQNRYTLILLYHRFYPLHQFQEVRKVFCAKQNQIYFLKIYKASKYFSFILMYMLSIRVCRVWTWPVIRCFGKKLIWLLLFLSLLSLFFLSPLLSLSHFPPLSLSPLFFLFPRPDWFSGRFGYWSSAALSTEDVELSSAQDRGGGIEMGGEGGRGAFLLLWHLLLWNNNNAIKTTIIEL